ncbi:hypothetical protein ACM0AZ_25015 [Mycobacteroides abscessus subsp. massiliense]|uniref:hypothetical protein n=1 Tax=Mycobacteroides abscessus TaxID=36809 RepID=UPI0019D197C9|nr:hypothetical protein [Mycobacteroides abscessus]MBN7567095.1 hypothetical protein [Mycobacteroides abscessus subsp. massiliense]
MIGLPAASVQNPACGACVGETTYGGDKFICEDCQLGFSRDDFAASSLDPDAEPCGAPCDNFWHGDHKIKQGYGYDCSPCKLPTGHTSLHWTGCEPRPAA